MALDIYLCYAQEDSGVALNLVQKFEHAGLKAWVHERDSVPGYSYLEQIHAAISQARLVVVIVSLHSIGPIQTSKEVILAFELGKPLMSLLLGITHEELLQKKPEWRFVIGASVCVTVPPTGLDEVVPGIIAHFRAIPESPVPDLPVPSLLPSEPPFEAYSGDDPYLFVSYSHKDNWIVYPEIGRLHRLGFRIWYDEGIDPGNEWPQEVAEALAGCAFFLVFISSRSVESTNVRNEINFAINRKKPLLAIHVEETTLPTGLELRMGDIQAILKWRMTIDRYQRKMTKSLPDALKHAQS